MILSAQTIRFLVDKNQLGITPFERFSKQYRGLSYGLTAAGYDIRIGSFPDKRWQRTHLHPGEFLLTSSLERLKIPNDLQVIVHDKSSLARAGLAIQNTVLEPGWEGHITLELSNHGRRVLEFYKGQPIAQLIFHQLDEATELPYVGKYQNQGPTPVEAIMETESAEPEGATSTESSGEAEESEEFNIHDEVPGDNPDACKPGEEE